MRRTWFLRAMGMMLTIVLMLCTLPAVPSKAQDIEWVEMGAYVADRETYGTLTLMKYDGEMYIYSEDARVLSGAKTYQWQEENGEAIATFTFGAERICPIVNYYKYGTRIYFQLKELMDQLKTRYYYDEAAETLVFVPCSSFAENLKNDCMSFYCNDAYDVKYMENTVGVVLATAYNLVGGLRIDALWGAYSRELYEEVLSGIMQGDEEDDVAEFFSTADKTLGKLASLIDFTRTDIDGVEHFATFMGADMDEIVLAYDTISDGPEDLQGIGLGTVIEIFQRVRAVQYANEIYYNAVCRSLLNDSQNLPFNIRRAVEEVCAYYDENTPTTIAIIQDLSSTVLNETAKELVKDYGAEVILLQSLRDGTVVKPYINSLYVKATKIVLDQVLGMKDKTKAVEHTRICRIIQEHASSRFHDSFAVNEQSVQYTADPLLMKYSTILYLRACQYAWSLYEFDDDLEQLAKDSVARCGVAIKTLTAYDDHELTMAVDNPYLNLGGMAVQVSTTPAPTATPAPEATAAATPSPTPSPRPPEEFLFSENAIVDGDYYVTIDRYDIRATSSGWTITADVYEYISITQEDMNRLQVGDTIGGYPVEKLKWQRVGGKNMLYISNRLYLNQGGDGLWYLHQAENDLFIYRDSRDRPVNIVRGTAKLYDNFTYLMYGVGSQMQEIDDLTDYFSTPYYADGGTRPLELVITVQGGAVRKVVWEYRP